MGTCVGGQDAAAWHTGLTMPKKVACSAALHDPHKHFKLILLQFDTLHADFVEAGRAETARWARQCSLAALLTLPVFLSSMVLPMAWPAAAAWLAARTVRWGSCWGGGAAGAGRLVSTVVHRLSSPLSQCLSLQLLGFPLDQLLRLGFATPVQFWCGWRFHRGAYLALRGGRWVGGWVLLRFAVLLALPGSCCMWSVVIVEPSALMCYMQQASLPPAPASVQSQHGRASQPGHQRRIHLLPAVHLWPAPAREASSGQGRQAAACRTACAAKWQPCAPVPPSSHPSAALAGHLEAQLCLMEPVVPCLTMRAAAPIPWRWGHAHG